jgi:hypothetical protein
VPGNKSLSIGYNYSCVNLGFTPEQGGSRWSLPLSVERVGLSSDGISTAISQISALMADDLLPFSGAKLIKNASDSGYFSTRYFAPLVEKYPNMVQICQDRHGSKVWQQASICERTKGQKGSKSVYGKETGQLLLKKPMFIAVFGQLKNEISTIEAYQEYRNRYDIEGHNRFSSHQLLLND